MNDRSYFERSVSVSASDDIGRRLGGSERRKGDPGGPGKIAESRRKSASFDVNRSRGSDVLASACISGGGGGASGGGSAGGGGGGGAAGGSGGGGAGPTSESIRRRSSSNSSVNRRSQSKRWLHERNEGVLVRGQNVEVIFAGTVRDGIAPLISPRHMQRVVRHRDVSRAVHGHQTGGSTERCTHGVQQLVGHRLHVPAGELRRPQHIERQANLHDDIAIAGERHTAQCVICVPEPMIGVSPTRPKRFPVTPPVEVAAAMFPYASMATAPTVPPSPLLKLWSDAFHASSESLAYCLAGRVQKPEAPVQRERPQAVADEEIVAGVEHDVPRQTDRMQQVPETAQATGSPRRAVHYASVHVDVTVDVQHRTVASVEVPIGFHAAHGLLHRFQGGPVGHQHLIADASCQCDSAQLPGSAIFRDDPSTTVHDQHRLHSTDPALSNMPIRYILHQHSSHWKTYLQVKQ
uniref:Uncharacterized protein n=1 Tax=Anopheles atroparvus TaxID=41427 RepID=A0A182JI27_ANOAO